LRVVDVGRTSTIRNPLTRSLSNVMFHRFEQTALKTPPHDLALFSFASARSSAVTTEQLVFRNVI
jgi:hypothetical protein